MSEPGRLRSSQDVRRVLQQGRRRGGEHCTVHVLTQSASTQLRVAVVASKRVGNAVARNRAKRLLRESSRRLPVVGADVVLIARPAAAGARLVDVQDEVERLFVKLSGVAA